MSSTKKKSPEFLALEQKFIFDENPFSDPNKPDNINYSSPPQTRHSTPESKPQHLRPPRRRPHINR